MNRLIFMFKLIALITFQIFFLTMCETATGETENIDGRTHFTGSLEFKGEQVWEHNENATKLSNAYKKFTGSSAVSAIIYNPGDLSEVQTGSGIIEQGVMKLKINEIDPDLLLEWNDLNRIFSYWNEVAIDNPDVKCQFITIVSSDNERLLKERLSGTEFSIGQEILIFIYANADCRITGNYGEGKTDYSYYYTEDVLDLTFKKGWNTLCQREAYGFSGKAAISMEIKNPPAKWVIYR